MLVFQRITFVLIWLNIFTMPWQVSFIITGIGSVNKLVGLLLIPAVLLTVILKGKFKKPEIVFYMIGLFFIWNVLSIFWSIESGVALEKIFLFFQLFILAWATFEFTDTKKQIHNLFGAYIYGNGIVIILTLYHFYATDFFLYSTRFYLEGYNPNSTGAIMALGIPMALYLAYTKSKWYLSYIPLAVFSIFIMASRSVVLVLIMILMVTLIFMYIRKMRYRKSATIVIIGMALFIVNRIPEGQRSRIFSIGEELSGGTFSNRTIVWENGVDAFTNNFFIGVGAGNFMNGTRFLFDSLELNAHNAFLSVAVENGIVGLLLFLSIIFILVIYIIRMKDNYLEKWFALCSLLPWIVMSMSSHNEAQKYTWIIFTLIISLYAILKKEKKKAHVAT